jgi:hypothetical protein
MIGEFTNVAEHRADAEGNYQTLTLDEQQQIATSNNITLFSEGDDPDCPTNPMMSTLYWKFDRRRCSPSDPRACGCGKILHPVHGTPLKCQHFICSSAKQPILMAASPGPPYQTTNWSTVIFQPCDPSWTKPCGNNLKLPGGIQPLQCLPSGGTGKYYCLEPAGSATVVQAVKVNPNCPDTLPCGRMWVGPDGKQMLPWYCNRARYKVEKTLGVGAHEPSSGMGKLTNGARYCNVYDFSAGYDVARDRFNAAAQIAKGITTTMNRALTDFNNLGVMIDGGINYTTTLSAAWNRIAEVNATRNTMMDDLNTFFEKDVESVANASASLIQNYVKNSEHYMDTCQQMLDQAKILIKDNGMQNLTSSGYSYIVNLINDIKHSIVYLDAEMAKMKYEHRYLLEAARGALQTMEEQRYLTTLTRSLTRTVHESLDYFKTWGNDLYVPWLSKRRPGVRPRGMTPWTQMGPYGAFNWTWNEEPDLGQVEVIPGRPEVIDELIVEFVTSSDLFTRDPLTDPSITPIFNMDYFRIICDYEQIANISFTWSYISDLPELLGPNNCVFGSTSNPCRCIVSFESTACQITGTTIPTTDHAIDASDAFCQTILPTFTRNITDSGDLSTFLSSYSQFGVLETDPRFKITMQSMHGMSLDAGALRIVDQYGADVDSSGVAYAESDLDMIGRHATEYLSLTGKITPTRAIFYSWQNTLKRMQNWKRAREMYVWGTLPDNLTYYKTVGEDEQDGFSESSVSLHADITMHGKYAVPIYQVTRIPDTVKSVIYHNQNKTLGVNRINNIMFLDPVEKLIKQDFYYLGYLNCIRSPSFCTGTIKNGTPGYYTYNFPENVYCKSSSMLDRANCLNYVETLFQPITDSRVYYPERESWAVNNTVLDYFYDSRKDSVNAENYLEQLEYYDPLDPKSGLVCKNRRSTGSFCTFLDHYAVQQESFIDWNTDPLYVPEIRVIPRKYNYIFTLDLPDGEVASLMDYGCPNPQYFEVDPANTTISKVFGIYVTNPFNSALSLSVNISDQLTNVGKCNRRTDVDIPAGTKQLISIPSYDCRSAKVVVYAGSKKCFSWIGSTIQSFDIKTKDANEQRIERILSSNTVTHLDIQTTDFLTHLDELLNKAMHDTFAIASANSTQELLDAIPQTIAEQFGFPNCTTFPCEGVRVPTAINYTLTVPRIGMPLYNSTLTNESCNVLGYENAFFCNDSYMEERRSWTVKRLRLLEGIQNSTLVTGSAAYQFALELEQSANSMRNHLEQFLTNTAKYKYWIDIFENLTDQALAFHVPPSIFWCFWNSSTDKVLQPVSEYQAFFARQLARSAHQYGLRKVQWENPFSWFNYYYGSIGLIWIFVFIEFGMLALSMFSYYGIFLLTVWLAPISAMLGVVVAQATMKATTGDERLGRISLLITLLLSFLFVPVVPIILYVTAKYTIYKESRQSS